MNLNNVQYFNGFVIYLFLSNIRSHLNISGIENYSNLQDVLPLCWSTPSLGNAIRHDLEPPLVQQAAFDDTVSVFFELF